VCANLADMEGTHRALLWRVAEQELRAKRGLGPPPSKRDLEYRLSLSAEIDRLRLALRALIGDMKHVQQPEPPLGMNLITTIGGSQVTRGT
jgi:hypothetical protein